MFILDGKPLSLDRAFTHNGLQYPANWLRLASPAERTALGITEAPDAPAYDQRFFWGVGVPKDLNQLKDQYKLQQKESAQSLLRPTDWAVVRGVEEPGKPVGLALKNYRAAVRSVSSAREAEIVAVTTVEELVELLNGQPTITDPEGGDPIPNPGLYLTPWPDVVSI